VAAMRFHLTVLLRLVVRIEQLAHGNRDIPPEFAQVATQGRHLTLWVLQYLRDLDGLAAAVDTFESAKVLVLRSWRGAQPIRDVDVRLARGALEELRAVPDAVAQSARSLNLSDTFGRDRLLAREERRLVDIAAHAYEALLVDHPAVLEAHLRLAHLELRLGRVEQAEAHLVRVAGLEPDARQAYLAALFLADVYERQGRLAEAIAAYGVAQQNWPTAQTPGIGLARLRALSGSHEEARAALNVLRLERPADAPQRSDPWMGYMGAQAWRLPSAIRLLQASFEAEP
jgi:tetratricopeptide (TPR) repeat protein